MINKAVLNRFYTLAGSPVVDVDLYIQGSRDCEEGKPHEAGKGDDYDRGYASRYEIEQILGQVQ